MSKTYLHKEKGKSKHGVYGEEFQDYPFKVKKYYDRHCGSNDDKVMKMEKQEKKEHKHRKRELDEE